MKKIISTITLLVCLLSASAQTTVKGILVDSLTNEGEPYATVRIYNVKNADKPVAMTLTDINGNFSPTVTSNGNYIISFSSVGRVTVSRNLSVTGQKEVDLGTIFTRDDAKVLSAVEVVAQKPIVKMEADKMTYSVADDPTAQAQTVLDVLRKVPMVTVDGQDNISVNGSSSFKVYVDGKQNPMFTSNASQIFKAMPASMVSSIEVVTNPGAKYDAEGAGGILDIKMAKSMGSGSAAQSLNGYNGTISVNGGNRGAGVSALVSGQQGKFSYNANVDTHYMDNGTIDVEMTREQNNGSSMTITQDTHNKLPIVMGTVGMGYELDSLSSVNASFGLTTFDITSDGRPSVTMKDGTTGQSFSYSNYNKTKMRNHSFNGSLDYQRFFNADHTSSLMLTYQLNTNPGRNDTETTFDAQTDSFGGYDFNSRNSIGRTNTVEHVAQADLVTKLTEHQTLNTGLKYINRNSTSDTEYYQSGKFIPGNSTDYANRDQVGAAYAELENKWTNWSTKVGLRYEHTWQDVSFNNEPDKNFTNNYGNLVPSASLSHVLKPGQNLGLTYNMRISRPGITYLNPYIDRSDPTALTYGNKDLLVEKTHNIGLVYNFYSPVIMMNATLRQTFADGGIEQYSFYKDNILHTTYDNCVDRSTTSLTIFASLALSKTTRLIFNGGGSYNDIKSDKLDCSNNGFQANAMFSLQQQLPKNWNVGATFITNTKSYTLQGHSSGMNIGVLTASKSFLDDKLNCSLSCITGLSKGGKLHINQFSQTNQFTNDTRISVPLTRIQATISWKFGNTKKQFQQRESRVQTDYIEHQSSTESIGNAGNLQ